MKTAHQYMIALTEAERTPSVKAMVDIILLDALKEIEDEKEKAFQDGKSDTNNESYWEGHEDGYAKGYEKGLAQGSEENSQGHA